MTLIIGATGSNSIWLLADRRLSWQSGKHKDNARKLLILETTDGVALLGYAGLGLTKHGNEPADWMARVMRSENAPLEQSLNLIANAIRKKIPRHLQNIHVKGTPQHLVIIPAFLNNLPCIYAIGLALPRNKTQPIMQFTKFITVNRSTRNDISPRVVATGSGALNLPRRKWTRELLRLIKAHDSGKINPRIVANFLADINNQVAKRDHTVGKKCIVVWRIKDKGGGGFEYYSGVDRDTNQKKSSIPTITHGMDINVIVNNILPHVIKSRKSKKQGAEIDLDADVINSQLSKLPWDSDDTLL